ncbi:hypothetical protein [Microbacterium sp.]|uniref:hypothetical protein n=1 Tax=Microbacterium sp. TaxID=51671 RepID=UPI002811BAB8|nr:hypothetical protein [Microbacterium sp.]
MAKIIQLDAEMADSQFKLLVECTEMLDKCQETAESLREGQSSLVWTADGKSVDLAAALTSKYNSSVLWLTELRKELREASENLDRAVKDTTLLDDTQKSQYQNLLYRAVGRGPNKPIAI